MQIRYIVIYFIHHIRTGQSMVYELWLIIVLVGVCVGWVRRMYMGVYVYGCPGEVGKRDMSSAVIVVSVMIFCC